MITRVGGHFCPGQNGAAGNVFAAIARLSGASAYPAGSPFAPGEVLATTLLPIPAASSTEVLVPLALSLQPGHYLLVFGSGMYGASGEGGLTTVNPALAPPVFTTYNPYLGWHDSELTELGNPNLTVRLVIEAVPEPSSTALLSLGVLMLGVSRFRVRTGQSRGTGGALRKRFRE